MQNDRGNGLSFPQHAMLLVEATWLDFRVAWRQLAKRPAFTATAVGILALGIGINTTVFTVTNAVLFRGFRWVSGNDRIVYIHSEKNGQYSGVSYPDFQDWRNQARSFDEIGAVADQRITLNDQTGLPERYTATRITTNGFHLLRQKPIIGRDFTPADGEFGAAPVAILSYGFWERRFGKDPAVLSRTLMINGAPPARVIGVMAEGFLFPQNQDLWLPLIPTRDLQKRDARNLWFAFARLRDGVTVANARAELETIGNRLAAVYPEANQNQIPRPHTFVEFFIGPHATMTYGMIWAAVGFVLLIACANLGNLLLARMQARSREIAQQIALGAGRWRIIRQLFLESITISIPGGVLGWWIAKIGVRTYVLATNPSVSDWRRDLLDYTMDYRVLAYLAVISIGTGILCGLMPALLCLRFDLNAILKNGGHGSAETRSKHPGGALLAAEMALAVVLIAGAGAMVHSFLNIYTADVGARIVNLRSLFLHLPEDKYSNQEKRIAFVDNVKTRFEALPGVESVTLGDAPAGGIPRPRPYELAGDEVLNVERRPMVVTQTIGTDYFRTLSVTVSGREFNTMDTGSSAPVAIVNRRFGDQHWPGQAAIGQRLRVFDRGQGEAWRTVVGVVSNVIYDPTRQEITPVVYLPYAQKPDESDTWVLVRTHLPVARLVAPFRREISALDSEVPIWLGPYNVPERLAATEPYSDLRQHSILLSIFAGMALMLASFGVYAVIAHAVSQSTREIGIRMAIGATRHDIFQLIFKVVLSPLVLGLIIGLAGAVAVNRLLSAEFVGVSSMDPSSFIASCTLLLLSAASGCWIPARRAIRVDPMVALRNE